MKKVNKIPAQPAYTRIEITCDIEGCKAYAEECMLCDKEVCKGHGSEVGFHRPNSTLKELLHIEDGGRNAAVQWVSWFLCNECLMSKVSQFEGIGDFASPSLFNYHGGSGRSGRRKAPLV